jgi:septal ring factor EnvC (AmiA/AmiB activator)
MLYTTLSDEELRRIIDTNPEDFSAVREASSRFVNGSSQESAQIEMLQQQLAIAETDIQRLEEELDETKNEASALVADIKALLELKRA